jgi:indole-3-glycerol phosphate synthase
LAARAHGADSVLLIARIVPAAALRRLVRATRNVGIEPLVEVVTEEELTAALDADAHVIGVNARDLDTLVLDAARAARVLAAVPKRCVAVHLSGLKGPSDVAAMADTGIDGALIGEALMRRDDPSELLCAMARAARSARAATEN